MDQYEKMRKMNELAKDLKQHGFADSSFEAIKQANQIYGEDDITHEVKHGLIKDSDGETMEKVTDNDRNIKKLQENIDMLTNKMNEIIKAINDIDARITQLSKRPVERVIERQYEEKPAPARSAPVVEEKHEQKPAEYENQRVGNFQSQDVAIDKMFYFGKK